MVAGRPRTGPNRDLPPRLLRRKRRRRVLYYYQHADGRQEPLGDDLPAALARWHAIRSQPQAFAPGSFSAIANDFLETGIAGLAPKTQAEYSLAVARWQRVFGHAQIATITVLAVGRIMQELRGTPVQANRLKATLSRLWNWARSRGKTAAPNPCADVEGFSETSRKVVVTPAMFWALHDAGDAVLRDWMRLQMVIGQRVSDVLNVRRVDVQRERARRWLDVRATKTGTSGKIKIDAEAALVIDDLLARKVAGPWLVQTEAGQRVTYAMLRKRFDASRAKAKETEPALAGCQMRDFRKASLNQAQTLEEARRRGLHTDPRTTARHYEVVIEAVAGKVPPRQK